MNAPRGIKYCPTCDTEIDDSQTYCSDSCENLAAGLEIRDALRRFLRLHHNFPPTNSDRWRIAKALGSFVEAPECDCDCCIHGRAALAAAPTPSSEPTLAMQCAELVRKWQGYAPQFITPVVIKAVTLCADELAALPAVAAALKANE